MNENSLKKLEYDKILHLLSENAVTYLGKELSESLLPCYKKEKVSKLLKETSEAVNLIVHKGNLPITQISNVGVHIKNLESSYSLNCKGLLDIAKILKLSRELKDYFYSDKDFDISPYSILNSCFSSLYSNKNIEQNIFSCIIDEDTIADDASNTLLALRRNRKKIEVQVKETLNNMLHSKYIMEPIITIRNDRFVIPIKEEYRSNVKGYIHDISSSGSTVFIEPISVFELNNKISNIKMEEQIEIEKILNSLSSLLSPIIRDLENDVRLIGQLDFIFAKAKLSMSMDAICPNINDEKYIKFEKARHPLIDKNIVVPIDIEIGKDYNSLIITGPNTGGKTVALKTVGLLTIMALSGLHIPTKDDSSIYIFDNIFVDIGDEQSIQQSLSTFSAHMLNTSNIINNVTSNSLVLLDELGSGTDPLEGASLATAILEYLNKKDTLTIATTHYHEIKEYALITDGFENASFEFDVEDLKPTYKLLVGIPGKSNAFAISQKLGLKQEILDNAKKYLKDDNISIEELLKNIYDDKLIIEKQKEETTKNLNQAENLRKKLENELANNNDKEQKNLEIAKTKAQDIILSAKDDVNVAIKEIEEIYQNWNELNNIDINNLSDVEIANIVRRVRMHSMSDVNKIRNKLNYSLDSVIKEDSIVSNINKDMLKIGMKVKLNSTSEIASIVSIPNKGKKVLVQIGNAKMNVNYDDILSILPNEPEKKTLGISSHKLNNSNNLKAKNVNTEINVIGQNVEESCFIIDKYLDDCVLAKLQSVRIVHGKGTGKLREGIYTFLKKHPHVKSYRVGTFGEGEMGVTIVELK